MIKEFLIKEGFHPAPALAEMGAWLAWYKGNVKSFHNYAIWNGKALVGRKRDGMNMAKQVCQDWASLLMNERVEILPKDKAFKTVLEGVLGRNMFRYRANQLVEIAFALGTGAFVEYLDAGGEVAIDYVRGDCVYPLSWDNGEITDCAFASVRQMGGKEVYYINIHALGPNGYLIANHLIDKEDGKPLELPDTVEEVVDTQSNRPRFQIITPNLVNNVDLDSPFGISVFANAIPRLKKVDLIFDSGNNEFSLGRKRIIVPESMTAKMKADGLDITVFDPNDVAFYALPMEGGPEAMKPLDLTGNLRINEHSLGLQDALNYLSEGVGLGAGRYEFRQGGAKTATEVVSEKSDLFQNLQRHELILEKALRDLCRVVAEMTGHDPDQEIAINFDDSIITDRASDIEEAIRLTSAGLRSRVKAIMDLFGLSEEQAKKELTLILQEDQAQGGELHETYGLE